MMPTPGRPRPTGAMVLALSACVLLAACSACSPLDQPSPENETTDVATAPVDEVDDRSAVAAPEVSEPAFDPAYDAVTKQRLLASLPVPLFEEVTATIGLDFVHRSDPSLYAARAHLSVPVGIAGGGVAAADYDNDGLNDLFFAGGGGGRLYRNDAGRRLVDTTDDAGLRLEGESRAPYFVDYDNDGDMDLYLTFAWSPNRLFDNDGTGHFTDVTAAVGLGRHRDMTHEAVWFDMDGDGLLEIYTAHFGPWANGDVPEIGLQNFNAGPNRLYHHRLVDGRHVFDEIGAEAGVDDHGWTHAVGAWDADEDGRPDLFSLNDFARGHVYRNLGDGRFAEASLELGLEPTYNAMGFSLVDLDGDGRLEAYISEIANTVTVQGQLGRIQPPEDAPDILDDHLLSEIARTVNNRLYERSTAGTLDNRHSALLEPVEMGWAWDASALDYENDGDADLLVLNGTETRPPRLPNETRRNYVGQAMFVANFADESNVMFIAEEGFLYNVSGRCEPCYADNSRGSAFFDFDGDGDLDIAINDYEGPARLFRNAQSFDHAWVRVRLHGIGSNRNGVGATVTITDDLGRQQTAAVVSGGGFLSQNPPELHFGLGRATAVTSVEIAWPSGRTQRVGRLETGAVHVIQEPR